MSDELTYAAFILGYDLLHDTFAKSDRPETDVVYERCLEIAKDFINSDYNRNDLGLYTCLTTYLEWSSSFEKFEKRYGIFY